MVSRRPGANRRNLRMPPRVSAAAWSPTDYVGATHWWRADLGVTDAGAGEVSAWTDQIAGDSISQGVALLRPNTSTLDGQDSLYFDGDDNLQGAFGVGALTQPTTVVVVFALDVATGTQLVCDGNDAANRNFFYASTTWRYSAGTILNSGAAVATGIAAAAVVLNGASSKFFLDDFGTAAHTGNAGTGVLDGFTVGGSHLGSSSMAGHIAEVLIAESDDAASRTAMRTYLSDRYSSL